MSVLCWGTWCCLFAGGGCTGGHPFLRWALPPTWEQSELASQPRVLPVRALSTGDWIPSAQLVAMTAMRGAHFKTAGYHHHAYQTTVLRPEEALFLVEKGVLEVTPRGLLLCRLPCVCPPSTPSGCAPDPASESKNFHGHDNT